MRRFLMLILAVVLCLSLVSCTGEKNKGKDKETYIKNTEKNCPEFLYKYNWTHYDENNTEYISFKKNGEFSYCYGNSSSVEHYGAYNSYTYNEEEKRIELSGPDDSETASLIYYDENYLVLNFEKRGVQVFVTEEFAAEEYLPHENMEVYASQNWVCLMVLSHNDSVIQIAPYNYDKDSYDLFAPYITTFEQANDISFKFVGSVTENGEKITKHYDLDENKIEYVGEYYTSAYLHFDKNGMIDQGVFYGSLEIEDVTLDEEDERVIY